MTFNFEKLLPYQTDIMEVWEVSAENASLNMRYVSQKNEKNTSAKNIDIFTCSLCAFLILPTERIKSRGKKDALSLSLSLCTENVQLFSIFI